MNSILDKLLAIKEAKTTSKSSLINKFTKESDWYILDEVLHLIINPDITFNLNGVQTNYALPNTAIISLPNAVNSIKENLVTGKITGYAATNLIYQITNLMDKKDVTVVEYILNRTLDLGVPIKVANKFLSNKIEEKNEA
jgi:hypothetical protein